MNKTLLIILLMLLSLTARKGWSGMSLMAQSSQSGIVLEYQGQRAKTPLQGVGITAQNAGATQSAADGTFALQFRTLHVGDNIQMRRIERAGYEVMNQEHVEDFRIGREGTPPLQIVMITRKQLNDLRNGYRSVAAQRYEKQLAASEEEVERLKAEGKLAEEEYNERKDALEAEYEEKLSRLESYIDKFARIDLSEIDAIEQQIVALIQSGDMDAALRLYEEQGLPAKLAQSRADREKLIDAQAQLAQAQHEQEQKNLRLRQSIDRQITLLLMMGGEENLHKALGLRREVFLADTTDFEAHCDYAALLQNNGFFDQAISLLSDAVRLHDDDYKRGQLLINIANIHAIISERDSLVISILQQADSLLWPLRESHYRVLTRSLPAITDFLIEALPNVGRDEELAPWIERLRTHWTPDTLDVISLNNYRGVLLNLTDYDSQMEQHEESLQDVAESMRLDAILQRNAPWIATPHDVNAVACHTYAMEGHWEEMVSCAHTAMTGLQQYLPKVKASATIMSVLQRYYQVLEALVLTEHYALADSVAQQIRESQIIEMVDARYPGWMDIYFGYIRLYASYATLWCDRIDEAEEQMNQALDFLDTIEEAAFSMTYLRPSSLAQLHQRRGNLPQAEKLYLEAIEAQIQAADGQLSAWDADNVCHYYIGLTDIARSMNDKKKANKYLKLARQYTRLGIDTKLVEKKTK